MSNQSTNQLINFTLHLADNALILGHRNSEWCGHGPVLEQDIAITNISLDLIGQSRNFYQYAATLMNDQKVSPLGGDLEGAVSEDTLAYLRDNREFKNCLLVELPNGDWAKTILRQFLFSTYQFYLYQELQNSKDKQLAAIAEKSLKEVTYHLRWSSEWVIRLGDGTNESHERMLTAIDELWRYVGELFTAAGYELQAAKEGSGVNPTILQLKWEERVKEIFAEATLPYPEQVYQQTGGKEGKHTEHLGYILTELQFMQRAYPNSEW
ncbi:MAG TPA: 1,2-phenylacetyl-CoA epoxidase subunit PaaC [Chitinophagaceae bacterium]|jgi:ring-1,2-phenylacetyl-CoA epoxidase subunit PaaC|nr:1,2-phenylacetyl-CoA epoxidase subunit PaaC [Chitinophagaceae bacterium]